MCASFVMGVLIARGLGVEDYGYYSLALSVITIASIPGEFGLPFLVTREVAAAAGLSNHPKLFGVLRWANRTCLLVAGLVGITVLAGGAVASARGSADLGFALMFGAPVVPLIALAKVRTSALQGLNQIVRGQIPQNLFRPVIVILLLILASVAQLQFSAAVAMAFNSLAAGGVLIVSHLWLKQCLPLSAPAQAIHSGRKWLSSTVPLGLMEGMRILQPELAILLMGVISSPILVGMLRIANTTAQISAAAIAVIVHVALPVMARLHAQGDRERLQKTVTGVAQTQFVGVLALCLPLLLFPVPLITFAFGPSFAPAATALRILSLSQILNAAFGPNVWVLNMTHHERRVTRAMAIALGVTLVTVPLLASRWGVTGAAGGLLASMLSWNFIAWRDARKLLGVETSILHWPWPPMSR